VPGYVDANEFTLSYTLLPSQQTVGGVLALTQQYGVPEGNGIAGLRRANTEHPLAPETPLQNNERLELVLG